MCAPGSTVRLATLSEKVRPRVWTANGTFSAARGGAAAARMISATMQAQEAAHSGNGLIGAPFHQRLSSASLKIVKCRCGVFGGALPLMPT